MDTHRALDRDSTSVDSGHHLAAIASFARNFSQATLTRDVGSEFLLGAERVVPILREYLDGDREREALSQLREELPKVRDALRQIIGDLDKAYARRAPKDKAIEPMEWLLVGIHMEGALFALLPERWSAMKVGPGVWEDREVLRNNIHWTHEGLRRAEVLYGAWRDAVGRV